MIHDRLITKEFPMSNILGLVLIVLILFSALDIVLIQLNITTLEKPSHPLLHDVYDKAGYARFKVYTLVRSRFNMGLKVIMLVVNLLFFLLIAPIVSTLVISLNFDFLTTNLIFLVIVLVLQAIITLPIEWLRHLMIEIPFGFSTTTFSLWMQDKIKSGILFLVIGLPLIGGLLHVVNTNPNTFMITLWAGALLFIIVTQILYIPVLLPLFNKLTPLSEGALKEKVTALALQANYEITAISVINASKRTNRPNAFFSGFGKSKHIILYDTLLTKLSDEQILSVLAHEIGHAKNKDGVKMLMLSAVNLMVFVALLQLLLTWIAIEPTFNVSEQLLIFKIIVFFVLIEPIQLLITILTSQVARKMEFQADRVMVQLGGKTHAIAALKTLSRENFVHLNPHPLVVRLNYSHPPLKERLEAIVAQD